MALSRWLPYVAVLAVVAIAAYAFVFHRPPPQPARVSSSVPPVAVLGDSDSHSYQDRISFPPGDNWFQTCNCNICHAPTMHTRADYPIPQLANIDAPM